MHTPKLRQTVLVMALAAVYPLSATAAVSAGVAQFIAGDVNVRRPDGGTAPLAKGKDIESGESILTGVNGRAQVRFTDGGLISLQPNTEFKIANYSDNAANPKEERFLVDLLRGSMRAITGLIGKRNRENYKVTTTTATIGIRGSGFNVGYNPDGSLGVTTELDAIEVCNAGGCVGLTAGESVRVISSQDAPVRTNTRAAVPTPASPEQEPTVAGNQSNSEGKAAIVTTKTEDKVVNSGTFSNLKVGATYFAPIPSSDGIGSKVSPGIASSATLVDGKLTTFTPATDVYKQSTTGLTGSAGTLAGGDFIGWGTWTSGSKNSSTALNDLHYIVGQPTTTLPTTTGNLTYSFSGGTVTGYDSNSKLSTGAGTVGTNSNLVVSFTGNTVAVNLFTSLGNLSATATITGGSTVFSYSGGGAYGINGFFVGTNANRAGLTYTTPGSAANSIISGSAAFQAP